MFTFVKRHLTEKWHSLNYTYIAQIYKLKLKLKL